MTTFKVALLQSDPHDASGANSDSTNSDVDLAMKMVSPMKCTGIVITVYV